MTFSRKPTEIAALPQADVAQNDDQSSEADDILAIAAELLVYSTSKNVIEPSVKNL